ncbi:MAG: hypothetical protein ACI9W4_001911 [Rhodothermales bacterium]
MGVVLAAPARAQALTDTYLLVGPATLPGAGVWVSSVKVGPFVTREAALAVAYRSSRDGSIRTVTTVGGALRLLGARQTVFDGPRGSFDLDLGFRIGPAILFRFEETAIEKNKRFTLVADPFVRIALQSKALLSLELGIHRPALRAAVWLAF